MRQFKKFKGSNVLHHYIGRNTIETQKMYNYLQINFMPLIKEYFPLHYLLERRPKCFFNYLDKHSSTHPYFLRFNIKQFYPSITKLDIEPVLINNYEELTGCFTPANMSQYLHLGFDSKFTGNFNFSSISGLTENMGIDSRLSGTPCRHALYENDKLLFVVTAAYMLGFYHALSRWPFLCFHDDFVVLFHSQAEVAECLLLVYLCLQNLGLELNSSNISHGRVYQDGFIFKGYEYTGNTFCISPVSEKAFRHKIIRLTTFSRKYKNQQAFIKQLNHQITVFGHYYKYAQVAARFKELDSFIRKRVRQFLFLASDLQNRTSNLPNNSRALYSKLGLYSLVKLRQTKETKMVGYSPVMGNAGSDMDESPVFNKIIVEKLLQQTLFRYIELRRQEKIVIGLLEHLAPLSDEIKAQPGNSIGIL
ncbi:hypothetical protein AQPE_0379 [Aquipluma nitroreducens]|uniref:Group II intron maturase-specific domain-containing protein n=1 Tax=Aquipluma nitroreducens TaxID=2010828 RepID=A0A5K7S3X0_9BACT|nr:group II intron maturase-specific domain-containing protein [Aquipluma nitroreducens]BBE16242.1 hypothetical protein AQPE_0379 [Aquipluma nitroreducens]